MTEVQVERVRNAIKAVRMRVQPLQRQGDTRYIAHAAMFLAGDRSQQVTGVVIPVDGGATAGLPLNKVDEIAVARSAAMAEMGLSLSAGGDDKEQS